MKKFYIAYFIILLLINCGSDNPISPPAVQVIGKWNFKSKQITEERSTTTLTSPEVTGSITFYNSVHTLSLNIVFEGQCVITSGKDTYRISGNTITFIPS